MKLDRTDRALIRAVLEDASRSLRALAEEAGVTAPTVSARLARLEDLGVLGPVRREVDLARLGRLVLVLAGPEDQEDLAGHEHVFRIHRTQQNRLVAMALLEHDDDLADLHERFPRAETLVLTEQLEARAPGFTGTRIRQACSQCGKEVDGDEGIQLKLGGRSYVACCPMCEQALRERYERHAGGT